MTDVWNHLTNNCVDNSRLSDRSLYQDFKIIAAKSFLRCYIFPRVILYIVSYFCSFMVVWGLGFRVGFLDRVFCIGVFMGWASGPVVWGLLGF